MNVTASMIEFVLQKQGLNACVLGNDDCPVSTVRENRKGKHEAGVLYVCEDEKAPTPPKRNTGYALLAIADESGESARSAKQKHPERPLIEAAFSALRELDLWESKLKDALLQRVPLAEFIRLGWDMIGCPIAYFDRNLIVLASSEDYWKRDDAPREAGLRIAGQMPSELAVDLVEDLDYLKAAERHEPFYYENTQNRIFYGVNTFDDGEYLARLVISLPEGTNRLHPGQEQLVALYHRYLDDLYLHYAGNVDVVSSQNDALHELVSALLLEGKQTAPSEMTGVLSAFGWRERDDFMAVKLVFFEGVHWDTISLYLCGLLERTMAASCAFPVDREIVWLVNLSRSAWAYETRDQQIERLVEALVSIMRDYACKAGLSDVFAQLTDAHDYYREAVRALEIGQRHDPHHWYYRFSDYAYQYLLAKDTEEFKAEQLCHPALTALAAYDASHETEYARTLVCFLRNSQNTTHTAGELYIHRTSFTRRMAHMQEIAPVNLDDPDEILHLLLSAKLLGM
ncbi:MAG: helix-turn-helix domain-containing protein [Eggerthellaceae bacterium]|nr:helix-turn-helix domain-containing protein [Eggerthellaceae bacterium]